jgi:hypothetical protein
MRLAFIALIALCCSILIHAEDHCIRGQTYTLKKNGINRVDFLSQKCVDSLKTRIVPACPPAPGPAPVLVVPSQNPNAIAGAFFPTTTTSNSLVAPPQTIGTTFVAGDQSSNAGWTKTPPETMASVGPQQIVAALNPAITSFTKAGVRDNVLNVEPSSFLNLDGDFNTIADMFEPSIYFDSQSSRWYYIALNANPNGTIRGNNGFSIAVSSSSVLTSATTWTVVNIFNATLVPDENGCPGDQNLFFAYPTLGVDSNALYTSFAMFDVNGNYLTSTAFVIQKKSLLNPGPVFVTVFRDVVGDVGDEYPYREASSVLTPAINFDTNPQFGYYLATDPMLFGKLNLYRVINPGSTSPTLSPAVGINVLETSSSAVPSVPFMGNLFGNLGVLKLSDDRIRSPIIRNGQLYATQTIMVNASGIADTTIGDPAARSAARWYQLSLNGAGTETATTVPTLIQAGTLFDNAPSNPLWYNMPSLMVNSNGDLAMGFTVSSNLIPTSAGFVGRISSDPLGSLRIGNPPPSTYAVGSGQYSRALGLGTPPAHGSLGQPWGSYSSTSLDPSDSLTMWTIQELANNSLEQVVVAQLIAP